MDWLANPDVWIQLVTLTTLEVVLGIDNIVFISILSNKLPPAQQPRARKLGLALALVTRVLLLLSLNWVMSLTQPLMRPFNFPISGRDLILFFGGLFLIAKATREIHEHQEGTEGEVSTRVAPSFTGVLVSIMLLDVVFSLDSVITAVGMSDLISVMVGAVIIAVLIMLAFSGPISAFVSAHPTVRMLALSFLILIGVNLLAEGLHQHIPKGYIYFAMAFSVIVEMLNLRVRSRHAAPVHLRHGIAPPGPEAAISEAQRSPAAGPPAPVAPARRSRVTDGRP
jgi:predicted tellurium resistance membrane protein TerC